MIKGRKTEQVFLPFVLLFDYLFVNLQRTIVYMYTSRIE